MGNKLAGWKDTCRYVGSKLKSGEFDVPLPDTPNRQGKILQYFQPSRSFNILQAYSSTVGKHFNPRKSFQPGQIISSIRRDSKHFLVQPIAFVRDQIQQIQQTREEAMEIIHKHIFENGGNNHMVCNTTHKWHYLMDIFSGKVRCLGGLYWIVGRASSCDCAVARR